MKDLLMIVLDYGKEIFIISMYFIISYISIRIKNIINKYVNEFTKKNVAELCVNASEQINSFCTSDEKYEYAKTNIKKILNEKNIKLSDTEIKVLIESFCYSLEGGNHD